MNKLIQIDFKNKKIQSQQSSVPEKPLQRLEVSNVSYVNFKTRKLIQTVKTEELVTVQYDFTNFNAVPADSNFSIFTDEERMGHNDWILENLAAIDFCDILHFINMGVLDKKKLAEKLNIVYQHAG